MCQTLRLFAQQTFTGRRTAAWNEPSSELGSEQAAFSGPMFGCANSPALEIIWSSAGPSEKGLVTDSRKSIGRLKRSPRPPSLPMVFKFGYVTYSMSIFMLISFDSLFLLSIKCYCRNTMNRACDCAVTSARKARLHTRHYLYVISKLATVDRMT